MSNIHSIWNLCFGAKNCLHQNYYCPIFVANFACHPRMIGGWFRMNRSKRTPSQNDQRSVQNQHVFWGQKLYRNWFNQKCTLAFENRSSWKVAQVGLNFAFVCHCQMYSNIWLLATKIRIRSVINLHYLLTNHSIQNCRYMRGACGPFRHTKPKSCYDSTSGPLALSSLRPKLKLHRVVNMMRTLLLLH